MLTVLVCGGREYADDRRVWATLDAVRREHGVALLVHGACGWDADRGPFDPERLRGADRHAHFWAKSRRVAGSACPAHWTTEGASAGPRRNARMLARYAPRLVVAFPGGDGTRGMVGLARQAGVRLELVDWTE